MVRQNLQLTALSLLLLFTAACNKPSDDSLTTSIKAKLYSDPLLKSASVDVSVKDGIVTLTGQVPDDAARLSAQHIAATTPGVKTVVDQTTMAAPPPATTTASLEPPPPPHAPARPPKPARTPAKPAPPAAIPASATAPAQEPASTPGPLHDPVPEKPSAPAPPPPPPPPQPITVTIPEGTIVTIRTIDPIDSSVNRTGQTFRASLDAPIVVGDRIVVPKGLNVNLRLVDASSAGKFKGRSELTVSLDSLTYQGKTYQIASSDVQEKGGSRGKRSAEVIGGGAVLGAIIGGLAGGGKGAAIGAGVGAGGGTAVQALTHGQQVKIPSEIRLDFTLHDPVDVTYFPKKPSDSSQSASPQPQSDPVVDAQQPPPNNGSQLPQQ
ncbi:MAG TPA: BON domain-containing protein [Candidatus Limnocylindrales bacterium]|nr:BON domain-containing protein [Candidatus Limnocylindrales bacterium]